MAGPLVPTLVQTVVTNIAASTAAIAQNITVTNAGDTLVLTVVNTSVSTGYAATAVSGAGATWYRVNSAVRATSGAVDIWTGVGASSGAQTVTATINGTSTAGSNLDEWRYLDASALINDSAKANSASGSSTSASLVMTPDNLNELVYIASSAANTQAASPGLPYSLLDGPTSSANQVAGIAYWVTNTLTASTATWTQSSGAWTVTGVVLRAQQPTGYQIWNAPAAQNNAGVLGQQAAPDYLDSVITGLGAGGTGVLLGCAVGPNLGTDLKYQVAGGTILVNGAPVAVAAASAGAITAANATNPRKDLVYTDTGGTLHYLAGVADATPCLPLPPIFPFVALAEIDVPALATQLDTTASISQAHVTDKRVILSYPLSQRDTYLARAGATAESIPRSAITGVATSALASGTLVMTSVALAPGVPIGHIAFTSTATSSATPTHWWFALFDSNRNLLAVTNDQTSTAWAASTEKSLAVARTAQGAQSSFVTLTGGLYYVGIMMAGTVGRVEVTLLNDAINAGLAPILCGTSSTGLTSAPTFPFQAAAITATQNLIYAWVGA